MGRIVWSQNTITEIEVGNLIDVPRKGVQTVSSIDIESGTATIWYQRSRTQQAVAAEVPVDSLVRIGRIF